MSTLTRETAKTPPASTPSKRAANSPRESDSPARVLSDVIGPIVEEHGAQRLILARQKFSARLLPPEVRFSKAAPLGMVVRKRGQSKVIARWPVQEMEALRFPCLFFVYSGEADIPLGDAILHCPPGYGVLIPPGVPLTEGRGAHWTRPHPEKAHSDILWMQLRPFGAECHFCHTRGLDHQSGGFGQHYVVNNRRLLGLAENLIEELTERGENYEAVSDAYFTAFFHLLLRNWQAQTTEPAPLSSQNDDFGRGDHSDPSYIVKRAQTYIVDNLGRRLTLQDIARSAYISRARLATLFREHTGQTVWDYVTQRRLTEARNMLEETDLYVNDIARLTGFARPSHFYARFAELTGTSPGEYRRAAREAKHTGQKPAAENRPKSALKE